LNDRFQLALVDRSQSKIDPTSIRLRDKNLTNKELDMTEYLAPGVYVEEVSFRGKSIEGVSTSTTGFLGTEFIAKLRHMAEGDHQRWRKQDRCDLGVPLLELFAWLTERLVARAGQVPDDGLPHAARLAAAALALIADRELPVGSVFKRTRFLPGSRLGEDGQVIAPSLERPQQSDHSRIRLPDDPV